MILGTGGGSFAAPALISISGTGGVQSSIACRDRFSDLVVTSPGTARLSILISPFGDADGDGKVDILSNGAAGRFLFFFKGNGDGTFASGASSTASPTSWPAISTATVSSTPTSWSPPHRAASAR
ncbi:hypothetical protein BE20_13355 [Sorangium cellulosum]|nr:hypothetical protein BE20_13355 [Sorangium cellulosum]